ncbi:hypothetical protein ACLKA6_006137 [Drosophila palustris]
MTVWPTPKTLTVKSKWTVSEVKSETTTIRSSELLMLWLSTPTSAVAVIPCNYKSALKSTRKLTTAIGIEVTVVSLLALLPVIAWLEGGWLIICIGPSRLAS